MSPQPFIPFYQADHQIWRKRRRWCYDRELSIWLNITVWWMAKKCRDRCLILHCWCFTMENECINLVSGRSFTYQRCESGVRLWTMCGAIFWLKKLLDRRYNRDDTMERHFHLDTKSTEHSVRQHQGVRPNWKHPGRLLHGRHSAFD